MVTYAASPCSSSCHHTNISLPPTQSTYKSYLLPSGLASSNAAFTSRRPSYATTSSAPNPLTNSAFRPEQIPVTWHPNTLFASCTHHMPTPPLAPHTTTLLCPLLGLFCKPGNQSKHANAVNAANGTAAASSNPHPRGIRATGSHPGLTIRYSANVPSPSGRLHRPNTRSPTSQSVVDWSEEPIAATVPL